MSRKISRRVPPVAPRKRGRTVNTIEDQHPPIQPRQRGADERIAERRVQSLRLRQAGASYRAIARQLGVDVRIAWEDVQAELGALRDLATNQAEDIRELELRRLDDIVMKATLLLGTGCVKAGDLLVKCMERRARLLGLDAPTKVAPTNPSGDKPYEGYDLSQLSEDELVTVLAILETAANRKKP